MRFSLKNPRTIAIVFVSALAIINCCMSLWGTFANVGIIPPEEGVQPLPPQSQKQY